MDKGHNRGEQHMLSSTSVLVYFILSLCSQSYLLLHTFMERLCVSGRVHPLALSLLCPESKEALEGYSLSMSLYFFRSMDTWSLNRTGSSLIWEWTRGMVPNQLANLFMQVWRCAKWSGSAQRDARELCPIIVSLYCFFWVTLMGGSLETDDTKKFIRMSSQFDIWSTIVFKLAGR